MRLSDNAFELALPGFVRLEVPLFPSFRRREQSHVLTKALGGSTGHLFDSLSPQAAGILTDTKRYLWFCV